MPFDLLEIGPTPAVIRRTLDDLSAEAVREAAATLTGCAAWIVLPKTGEGLARLTGVVEDRGVKRPAIELARTLLKGGGPAIPLIGAGYSSPGKLLNSVRTLLKKAANTPRRLFIIAVPDDLFGQILKTAQEPEPDAGTPPVFRGRSGAVLNLLELVPEPAPLRAAFIGHSADAVAVRQLILRAGQVDDTVLIGGDTGTGKEIVARQIHGNSPRRAYPLRAVNCGALPQDLLESELFGHVRGAFTGALTTTDGLWASADGGTLFLDEIGELSPGHQAKLLRALQERKIRKVGGDVEIPVNARVICASNRDLFAMVQTGQFREDLYYRLRGFLISIPPLREHPEDIPLLVRA